MIASKAMSQNNLKTKSSVFDAEHRTLTIGILLILTLVAFETLAVVTVAPNIGKALDGMRLYGWIFSAQLLASLFSIVLGGEQADKHGPARAFLIGSVIFSIGLLFAGFAPNMLTLIFGRFLQGLGAGAVIVAMYVTVNLAYDDDTRSRMMALMSTAWVVPALAGPAIAGFIADIFSWRIIFLGILPLVIFVVLLSTKQLLALKAPDKSEARAKSNWLPALLLALGAGCLISGLTMQDMRLLAVLAVLGIALALPNLNRLLPKGTLQLQAGLPSVIAARGFFYSSFAGVQAFLALMLTSVHGFSGSVTGLAIAAASISWTLGSWLQDKFDKPNTLNRSRRILLGSSLMTLGLASQLITLYTTTNPLIITLIGWTITGLGIGLSHSTSSVLAFALAPKGEEGHVSAGLQLVDSFLAALATGIGGALFAYAMQQQLGEQFGIMLAFCFSLVLALISILAAFNIRDVKTAI